MTDTSGVDTSGIFDNIDNNAFDQTASDASSGLSLSDLAGAMGVLLAIATAAMLLPARQALRVDPLGALRYD